MFRFVLCCVGMVILIFIGIIILVFVLIYLILGDFIEVMMGECGVDFVMYVEVMKCFGFD